MATPGKNWTKGTWRWATWAKAWDFTYDYIGDDWGKKAWGEQTWNPLAWYPAGLLTKVKQIQSARSLTTAESTIGSPTTGYTLPVVKTIFRVGEILDLAKTLPTIVQTYSLVNLGVTVDDETDANTLGVIKLLFAPAAINVGVVLPPIKNIYAPKVFDTVGITLPTVRVVFSAKYGDANLNTSVKGRKAEHEKLIRRGKGLFRRSSARAQEDLINEILTDVDSIDYEKDS